MFSSNIFPVFFLILVIGPVNSSRQLVMSIIIDERARASLGCVWFETRYFIFTKRYTFYVLHIHTTMLLLSTLVFAILCLPGSQSLLYPRESPTRSSKSLDGVWNFKLYVQFPFSLVDTYLFYILIELLVLKITQQYV